MDRTPKSQSDYTSTTPCHTSRIPSEAAASQATYQRRAFNIFGAAALLLPAHCAGFMNRQACGGHIQRSTDIRAFLDQIRRFGNTRYLVCIAGDLAVWR